MVVVVDEPPEVVEVGVIVLEELVGLLLLR